MPETNIARSSGPSGPPTDTTNTVGLKFNTTDNALSINDGGTVYPVACAGGFQMAAVTVTTAEVLALNATPKTIVAAPGAGKVIIFHGALVALDYNSAAYGGIAAGDQLLFRYTNGSGAAASAELESDGFLDATADAIRTIKAIYTDITPVANSPLVLHMATGEVTTGNSPLKVKAFYSVISTDL